MKYFTPQLLSRIRSADETVAVEALEEWQRALARWQRRWQKIKGTFPEGVRRFDADNVCLHAAQVLSMGRRGDTFVMVVETEPPRQDLVILTFTLDLEPEIQDSALADKSVTDFVMWLYEEWDVDRRGRCCFEVLLSNGWVVKLPLRDFQYLIVERILPGQNGQLARMPAEAVPKST